MKKAHRITSPEQARYGEGFSIDLNSGRIWDVKFTNERTRGYCYCTIEVYSLEEMMCSDEAPEDKYGNKGHLIPYIVER